MNEIILTSSILILFIAALRRLLRGRISPTLQYVNKNSINKLPFVS